MTTKQLEAKIKAINKRIDKLGLKLGLNGKVDELMELYHQRSDLLRKHEKSMVEDGEAKLQRLAQKICEKNMGKL